MSTIRYGLVAAIAVAAQVSASPFPESQLVKRYDPGVCNNQSCIVANIAGNTGIPPSTSPADYPVGSTYSGDCCVITLNPSVAPLTYQFNPKLKQCKLSYDKRSVDKEEESMTEGQVMYKRAVQEARDAMSDEEFAALEADQPLVKRACSSKILVYSKGTFEPGSLGILVGPQLKTALTKLDSAWTVQGVTYSNTIAGDYCLGLPGGILGKQLIESVVAQCPGSKVVLAGYSEGAMVVRNGLGNSTVQNKISGVLTFGDPFEGSPIKGYEGPIQVYCAAGDGVCTGQLDITAAHLSYTGNVTAAAAILNQMAS